MYALREVPADRGLTPRTGAGPNYGCFAALVGITLFWVAVALGLWLWL